MEDTKPNRQAPAAVGIARVEDRGNGFAVRVGRGIVGVWPTEGEAIDAKLCVDEAYAARQVAAAGPGRHETRERHRTSRHTFNRTETQMNRFYLFIREDHHWIFTGKATGYETLAEAAEEAEKHTDDALPWNHVWIMEFRGKAFEAGGEPRVSLNSPHDPNGADIRPLKPAKATVPASSNRKVARQALSAPPQSEETQPRGESPNESGAEPLPLDQHKWADASSPNIRFFKQDGKWFGRDLDTGEQWVSASQASVQKYIDGGDLIPDIPAAKPDPDEPTEPKPVPDIARVEPVPVVAWRVSVEREKLAIFQGEGDARRVAKLINDACREREAAAYERGLLDGMERPDDERMTKE